MSFIGANQTDSIETTLTQALVVHVVGPGGQSSAGQVVQFSAVPDSTGTSYQAYLEALTSQQPVTFLADTLDGSGHASVSIVLGTKAGTAIILVKVPTYGYIDTARFTVTPGKTAAIAMAPVDTAVIQGAAVNLHVRTVDHFGNATSGAVQVSVKGPGTINGQTVTTTGIGRITIIATSGALADTNHVLSLPNGKLAASIGNGIAIFNFDGTGMQKISLNQTVGNVRWAPSAQSLVFDQNVSGCSGTSGLLQSTDLSGNVKILNSGAAQDMYPSYSHDGTWVYFTSNTGSQAALWRVHPDGTNADSLNTLNPAFDLYPSVSPDGQQVAYATILNSTATDLRVLTVSTGVVTDLHISGWAPAWSPASNRIVYLQNWECQSPLAIANSDGTGAHSLTSDSYQGELDWSPDGQWIVAYNVSFGRIDLINASTGEVTPLTFSSGMSSPSWQPAH